MQQGEFNYRGIVSSFRDRTKYLVDFAWLHSFATQIVVGKNERIFMFLLVCLSFLSVNGRNYDVKGCVYSAVGKLPIIGCRIFLYQENILIDSTMTQMGPFNGIKCPKFGFYDLAAGKYTLVAKSAGYEPYTYELIISRKKKTNIYLDFFYLHPRKQAQVIRLGEAVKRATRIKLFHKGDTLIFDAGAFCLAEGSMLDALIAELPGVRLKEDGEITVNGETVDELLLNGKDFFRGDRMILLENMPSYMVKNVKVYRHDDLFRKEDEKRLLAMDVVLKKEYRTGWVANAEAAGGSSDRYLGRLFGLRFTDHSRLGLFGNINNTNDIRRPGSDGNWNSEQREYGTQRTKKAGLDFYTEELLSKWRFNTANTITDARRRTDTDQQTASFLPMENVYGQSRNRSREHDLTLVSNNTLKLDFGNENSLVKSTSLQMTLNISYRNSRSSLWSRTMESEVPFVRLADQTILFPFSHQYEQNNSLLNYSSLSDEMRRHELNAKGRLSILHRMKNSGDMLSGSINWDCQDENTTSFIQNTVRFPRTEQTADYRHNNQRTPVKGTSISVGGDYLLTGNGGWNYTFNIGYRHRYRSSDRSLFNLHKLTGWGSDSSHGLTELPSTRDEMQTVQDIQNSYYSSTYADNGEMGLKAFYWHQWDNGTNLNTYVRIPFSFQYDKLKYRRNFIDTTLTRINRFLLPVFYFDLQLPKNNTLHLDYRLIKSAPSLVNRLDIRDDVNPLNIIEGNVRLENTTNHEMDLSYQKTDMSHYSSFYSRIGCQVVSNALAMGFLYDAETGVRTTRPDNVNGNWNIGGNTGYSRCIDKKDRLTFDTRTGYRYLHSVDLTGTMVVERSVVETFNLNEELSLKYKIGKNTLGVKGKAAWSNIDSERSGFSSMNVTDFSYGLTALLNLPWKLQLNTDLTMFSRRGYESRSMNTDDLVWNARLSRVFLGGSLTCFVDGFDLLGNLSNVRRSVNAQGRTETRYNVVPRYVMLHVIYRLNKQPKKK